jgi:hypothetical protein
MANKDFSKVTWRQFFDARRNKSEWHSRMQEKGDMASAQGVFRQVSANFWTYFDDGYTFDSNLGGARELVFKYFVYRDKVLDDGGTPSDFERPTADGWE